MPDSSIGRRTDVKQAGPSPGDTAALLSVEPEVEAALIGRVIYGHHGTHPDPPPIPPSRFGVARHRVIWAAVVDQHRKGQPYDPITLIAELRCAGRLETAGGHAYIAGLEPLAGTQDSLGHYEARIRANAARRAFRGLGEQVRQLAVYDPDTPEASVKARYQSLVRRGDALCDIASRNGHSTEALRCSSLYELITAPQEPIPWVYDGWLAKGDIMVLAGESGLGKSILALELMVSLALSRSLGGLISNRDGQARVLYLDEENNPRLVRHRLRRLVDGLDLGTSHLDPAAVSAEYALENGVSMDRPESLERLRVKVERFAPDWIIFDSLVRLHHADENSNTEMAQVLGTMKSLARKAGSGAIIIHHLAKTSKERAASDIAQRIRGAGDIRGVADMVWGLERQDESLTLTHIKSRWGPESSSLTLRIEDVHAGNGMVVTATAPEREATALIVDELRMAGSIGKARPDLVAALEAAGYDGAARTASRCLAMLKNDGTTRSAKEGRRSRYWLSDMAPDGSE